MLAQVANEVDPFVDANTWLMLLGLVTPFVTALVARSSASTAVKGAVSGLVTALVAFVVLYVEKGDDLTLRLLFNGWVQIVATHALAFYMFLNKTVLEVNRRTPGFVGGSHVKATEA